MTQIHRDPIITARDTFFGDEFEPSGLVLPVSQDEIDELLYTEGLTAADRLQRLKQLRDQMAETAPADAGTSDARSLGAEIERAISELQSFTGEGMDPTSVDQDPTQHRETMSPDDDDLLDLLEREHEEEAGLAEDDDEDDDDEDDEDDEEVVLDASEWDDGDGFDPNKGVH